MVNFTEATFLIWIVSIGSKETHFYLKVQEVSKQSPRQNSTTIPSKSIHRKWFGLQKIVPKDWHSTPSQMLSLLSSYTWNTSTVLFSLWQVSFPCFLMKCWEKVAVHFAKIYWWPQRMKERSFFLIKKLKKSANIIKENCLIHRLTLEEKLSVWELASTGLILQLILL